LDGRLWSQVRKRVEWKEQFKDQSVESTLHYFVEHRPEMFVVQCDDGCQALLKCGYPTLTQVKVRTTYSSLIKGHFFRVCKVVSYFLYHN